MFTLIITTIFSRGDGVAISTASIPGFKNTEVADIAAKLHKAAIAANNLSITVATSIVQTQ